MAEITGLQDWELLQSLDAAAPLPALSDSSTLSSPAAVDDGGAIKHDYFSLNPHSHQPPSEADTDDAGIDSDNPSWLDPDSDTRYQRGQLNFVHSDSDSILSDESEKGEVESMAEVRLSPVDPGEEEVAESGLRVSGDGGGGEKKGVAWWKMPFEVLKLCVLRVRPLWPISVAAAFVAIAMLGRRWYRMKQRVRSVPMRVAMDDKGDAMRRVAHKIDGMEKVEADTTTSNQHMKGNCVVKYWATKNFLEGEMQNHIFVGEHFAMGKKHIVLPIRFTKYMMQ